MKWIAPLRAFWHSIPDQNILGRRVSTPIYAACVLGFVWLALLAFGFQARQHDGVLIPGVLSVEVSSDPRGYVLFVAVVLAAYHASCWLDEVQDRGSERELTPRRPALGETIVLHADTAEVRE